MRRQDMHSLHNLAQTMADSAKRLIEDDQFWATYNKTAAQGIRDACSKMLEIANRE